MPIGRGPQLFTGLPAIVGMLPALRRNRCPRWVGLRIDLGRVIEDRFGVVYAERSISRLLAELGFVHISARPQHPAQNPKVIDAYKKTSPERSQRI